jgi:alkaline phosphatase D
MKNSSIAFFVLLSGCAHTHTPIDCVWEPPAEVPEEAAGEAPADVLAGPMLGHATHREVTVWLETDGEADVRVVVRPADESAEAWEIAAESSTDHTHVARVTRLEPGVRYEYEVVVDGQTVSPAVNQTFETPALWLHRSADEPRHTPPEFTVAIGSCTYINDPPFDRVGGDYGGGYHIFESIRAAEPDLMLWLGDNTYLRPGDMETRESISARFEHDRSLPELQLLLASAYNYAIWDDHDFGPNDSDRSYPLRTEVLDVFGNYWPNPGFGTAEAPGAYSTFAWGDAQFFLLDDRSYRAPNEAPDGPDKEYLGEEQLQWLIDGLTSSHATFKIVVNGNQVLNDNSPYEAYAHFGHERDRLLEAIVERSIEGLVFLSGDRHHTELLQKLLPDFYPLYDFTSSPLTSGAASASQELDNPQRIEGTLVVETRNFGTLEFSGPFGDRVLTLRTYDDQGVELWQFSLTEHELTVE